jgi:hypothetical protein
MRRFLILSPVLLTLLLIVWTLVVYRHTKYGDWQIYPAVLVFPIALLCHILLIIIDKPKLIFVLYAVVHLIILALIWVGCLMLISKDSL